MSLALTDENFKSTISEQVLPVLVDFWAEWCAPCKRMEPIFEALQEELKGKVVFAKVNVDESPTIPAEFGVNGIPTLVLFINGNEIARHVGLVGKSQLVDFLSSHTDIDA